MKKLKLFMCVALFGAMSFGAFSAYDHYTMSEEERFFLANVEALTQLEPGGSHVPGYEVGNKKISGPNGVVTIPCCFKAEPHMLCASYIYANCVSGSM